MEGGGRGSNRSSGNYGYLVDHQTLEYDNIYTKPMESNKHLNRDHLTLTMNVTTAFNAAPPIPQRESRPKSQGFNNGTNNGFGELRTPTSGRCSLEYNCSSLPSLKNRLIFCIISDTS